MSTKPKTNIRAARIFILLDTMVVVLLLEVPESKSSLAPRQHVRGHKLAAHVRMICGDGTDLSILLFRSPETSVLGLWTRRQARTGPGARRAGPRAQLGLGSARLVRALSRVCPRLARPRQQRLGARRPVQPGRTRA